MMEAVLIGEKSKLEKVWTDNFRRTGTYHTLIIAGFHVTILAGCLLFLLRICMLGEMTALGVTVGAAWLYALVSGCNAPAVRAAGGFTLYAIARFFFRRGRVLNLLAAGGDSLPALGSRPAFRRRVSVVVPLCRRHRGARRALAPGDVDSTGESLKTSGSVDDRSFISNLLAPRNFASNCG